MVPIQDDKDTARGSLQLSAEERRRIEQTARELAEPDNPGLSTGTRIVLAEAPSERIDEVDRRFVLRLLPIGLAAAALELAPAKLRSALDAANTAKFGLPKEFISFVEQKRHQKNSPITEAFKATRFDKHELCKFIAELVHAMDNGQYATADQLDRLEDNFNVLRDIDSKLFLGNLLISEYTRVGHGTSAKKIVEALRPYSQKPSVEYLEKSLSTQYITLKEDQYLSPQAWGFDNALASFNNVVGSKIEMKIEMGENGIYKLKKEPSTEIEHVQLFSEKLGVPGFYALFWVLQYLSASCRGQELLEMVDQQYSLLKCFAKQGDKFHRAVWNMLFIKALQLHRQALQLDEQDAPRVRDIRDRYISAALGADYLFWRGLDIRANLMKRIDWCDMMPACFVLFVNSIPELRKKFCDNSDLGLTHIASAADDMIRPQRLRAAVDLIRKNAGTLAAPNAAMRNYVAGDGTLGVYLGPMEELKMRLQAIR